MFSLKAYYKARLRLFCVVEKAKCAIYNQFSLSLFIFYLVEISYCYIVMDFGYI